MAADGHSNSQQILQSVLDQTNQAIKISGTLTPAPGGSTAANQVLEIAALNSIDGKITDNGSGAVKVDGSAVTQPVSGSVSVSNFPATQPVSGTVTANQGTNPWVTNGSGFTQPVSAASLPLPTGASTAAKQPALGTSGTASTDVLSVQGIAGMTPLLVNGSGSTQPVSGNVGLNAGSNNVGSITNVTGTVSLPTGAATASNQTTANTSLASIDSKIPANLTVTSTRLLVDGSGVTQPVSGTVSVSGTISAANTYARIQTPVFFDGSTVQAAGGTRQSVATLGATVKRLQINDTTGLFIGFYDALTSGNLQFIMGPGQDNPIDITLASGMTLYAISMDTNVGVAGSNFSINFLG